MLYFTDEDLKQGSNFIMMIGAPGSGKTTFAKQFVKDNPDWYRLSPSHLRKLLTGHYNDMSKDDEVFDSITQSFYDHLDNGYNVIYDATNCNRHGRTKVIKQVRSHCNKIVGLISSADFETCINSNKLRNPEQIVPTPIVERMYINLKNCMPSMTEGFDIIAKFSY